MAEPSYHGAPGAGQSPVRHPPAHNSSSTLTPPLLGAFAAPPQTRIIVPLIFVPRLYVGSPAEIAGLLSAPALQVPGAYMHLCPATPLDRAEIRIGEGGNVARRLQQSADGWLNGDYSTTIIIACDHSGFGKTCAETVESRLTARLESTGYVKVQRDRPPKVRDLSIGEHRAIDEMLAIAAHELEKIGLDFLSPPRRPAEPIQRSFAPQSPQARDAVSEMLSRLDLTRPPRMPATPPAAPKPISSKPRPSPWAASRYVLHYAEMEGTLTKLGAKRFELAVGTQVSATEVPALLAKNRAIRKDLMVQGLIGCDRKRGNGLFVLRPIVVKSGAIAAAIVSGSTKTATHVWRPA
ncbi:hypothetical protein [Bosea sp. (in: a-proteobacteria)]|uniref:hypothetical protein n=1 Tax=Bosea sp. (in: a-proteobacteria) TaxID=1871050 RepID=UPI00273238BC|nr:hypothetical protein [Bosea sp. (in: a-proteobacteria)]MDP3410524.1 hypothetical protein [Bosea sp. (in: a-proteobacteria)]